MLGDYSFCLALCRVIQRRQTRDTDTRVTTTDHDSSSRRLDAAFLVFTHALTKFSRYIICIRFENGLRAVPSAEIFQNDTDMHVDSLLQGLSQKFGSPPKRPPQDQYPSFPKYQEDMISDIVTRWGGFSRELAYRVFVVQGVGLDPEWYREVEQVYLRQVQAMALANQPLEQVMDIFWPRDECWAALEGTESETTVLATSSTNLAGKVRTEELKTMLDYFTNPTPPSPSSHDLPSYLHTIIDSLYTPIETHPERYIRVLSNPDSMGEELPGMERYLRKVIESAEILGDYWKMLDRRERAKVLGMFE